MRKKPKKSKSSKYAAQMRHAQRRALERYSIFCSLADLMEIRDLIQSQKGNLVERQSLRVTVWDVDYKGTEIRVVYDNVRKSIVTFLHRDLEKYSIVEKGEMK
jgi:hypothetical protein